MSLLGLDLNSSRLHAVRGPLGDYPCTEPMEPPHVELPALLSFEGRSPVVGSAGLRICRKSPQLIWQNFLPQLAETSRDGVQVELHRNLTAAKALGLVLQHVMQVCEESDGVVLSLPAYLSAAQIKTVLNVADQTGLPLLGSISAPLAAALAAHAEQAWFGNAVVVDVDDHAMTMATIGNEQSRAQMLDIRCLPFLNDRVWRERMLNAMADYCILESRWDPRESAEGEQSLYDQIDELLDAAAQGRMAKISVRTAGRFQSLVLQPHDPASFCSELRKQAVAELEEVFGAPSADGAPTAVLLTAAAARLPGLAADLQNSLPRWHPTMDHKPRATISAIEDFGSGLLDDEPDNLSGVVVLSAGAAAQGAHSVAGHFKRGDIACGHLQAAAPLPLPLPPEAGPARLHFQGQDYVLDSKSFAIGRHPDADLVFDAEQWPQISARHCEIVYDRRRHMLCDRSRQGTLVNDRVAKQATALRPGDWIRLGPDGPLLRFLGKSVQLKTTA